MAPTISSARVLRAGPGKDSTISWTHLDSVAGKSVSGCGSMAPSGVWSDTRNMGADARRRRLEPARRPPGPMRTRNSSKLIGTHHFATAPFTPRAVQLAESNQQSLRVDAAILTLDG